MTHTLDFMGYFARWHTLGRIAVGCQSFSAQDLARVAAASDRMVRLPRAKRKQHHIAIRCNSYRGIALIQVNTDGSVRRYGYTHELARRAEVRAFKRVMLGGVTPSPDRKQYIDKPGRLVAELTGEVRPPKRDELYLIGNRVFTAGDDYRHTPLPILERL